METIQINNLGVAELQELIETSVKKALAQTVTKPEPEPETELLTRNEVAKMLQISLVTLTEWIKQGRVPAYKINSRVRFKKNEILNSLKEVQTLKFSRK